MTIFSVQVKDDFFERIAQVRPLLAIQELIWNSLDADATNVSVTFDVQEMGGISGIHVLDNGSGINYKEVERVFGNLGGSWKLTRQRSLEKSRTLHGKAGRGRFRAFRLGRAIEWHTCYDAHLFREEFVISSNLHTLGRFEVTNSQQSFKSSRGTEVHISDVIDTLPSLRGNQARELLAQQFALYLTNYPEIQIIYDGEEINPKLAIKDIQELDVEPVALSEGDTVAVSLSVIEWNSRTSKTFVLCDAAGFPRHEMTAGMHTMGYDFTAYIRSDAFRNLDEESNLQLEEMDPDVQRLVAAAKEKVREHFLEKTAQASVDFVQRWQQEHVYPYQGNAKSPIETVERKVFDVLALTLNTYMPGFEKAAPKQKELAMRLLKTSLESGPSAVLTIMRDVVNLPPDKQAELTRLLQKTSLTAIINASKLVANRLDFLKGLETLIFDAESKQKLLERSQLHKMLEFETWVFGEEFNLTNSDTSLTSVLEKHIGLLGPRGDGKENAVRNGTVNLEDGSRGIVDLMLSRKIQQPDPEKREHLIVELKRPSQKINDDVLSQVKKYAYAVVADERFHGTNTRWVFWALSNEVTPSAQREANQRNRPPGLAYDDRDENIEIWVKTWGQVIENCRVRLTLYENELKYDADNSSALDYLNRTHSKLLPEHLTASSGTDCAIKASDLEKGTK